MMVPLYACMMVPLYTCGVVSHEDVGSHWLSYQLGILPCLWSIGCTHTALLLALMYAMDEHA